MLARLILVLAVFANFGVMFLTAQGEQFGVLVPELQFLAQFSGLAATGVVCASSMCAIGQE